MPNQTWPGDSVMPVIRSDLRTFQVLFQIDQESIGVIRERACYATDRSLKRALVSSPLALIQPFFLFKSDGLGEYNQTKRVKNLVD